MAKKKLREEKHYLTLQDVCTSLEVSERRVQQLCRQGKIIRIDTGLYDIRPYIHFLRIDAMKKNPRFAVQQLLEELEIYFMNGKNTERVKSIISEMRKIYA